MPTVTVVVTCFNHEKFAIESLNSVNAQTFQDFELIIIDDCSRDNSVHVISDWLTKNCVAARFIAHPVNKGLCRSLNEALGHANGEYFAVISADDLWDSRKLEQHVNQFRVLPPEVAVVYSDAYHVDVNGKILEESHINKMIPGMPAPSGNVLSALLDKCFLPVIGTTIRTSALRTVGGYDERLRVEDYDMWLRIARSHLFHYVPGVLAAWRIVPTSMMHSEVVMHTPESSYTEFLISEKCLRIKGLSQRQREQWIQKQADAAYWLYAAADSRAITCLWKSFLRTKRLKQIANITMLIFRILKVKAMKVASHSE